MFQLNFLPTWAVAEQKMLTSSLWKCHTMTEKCLMISDVIEKL